METENKWCDEIAAKIDEQKEKFSEKDFKRYRLDVLVRAAKRAEALSADCEECERLKADFMRLADGVGELARTTKEAARRSHLRGVQAVMKHLAKQHKLTCEGDYTNCGLVLGMGIGLAIGASMDNIATGVSVGLCLGLVIGALWEADAKKKGRMI